ncbi:nickel-dependent lactate racemase [Candidatus Sumerlaeota bacterium]|nr:nickel-dependent lactate racemase [Candidatus Sumerlaeota bacterium]
MEIKIPYGREQIAVTIDKSRVAGIIYPNDVKCEDEKKTLEKALENPVQSARFSEFISGKGKTLFIVNDGTRPTPTAKVLDILEPQIEGKDCDFIIATGDHRAPNEEEYRFIFGRHLESLRKHNRIFVHDAKKDEDMEFIGTSSNGTEMWVNKKALEADRIVIIGSVEPHYFAGYTGGRKSFLPGLASRKTITMNHKFALRAEAESLILEGNPVHEDMIDALNTLEGKKIFSIQIVLDGKRRIYAAFAGDIIKSMDIAVEAAKRVFVVDIPEKEDIVVSVAPYPMDVDLYQSQKALDNGKLALNKGGILILVSKCRSGIGPATFYELMSSCDSPENVMAKIEREYKLGYHKAAKLAEILSWAEIWAVTDLEPDAPKKIFFHPFSSVQEAIDAALEKKGKHARCIFLMDGSITVPRVK